MKIRADGSTMYSQGFSEKTISLLVSVPRQRGSQWNSQFQVGASLTGGKQKPKLIESREQRDQNQIPTVFFLLLRFEMMEKVPIDVHIKNSKSVHCRVHLCPVTWVKWTVSHSRARRGNPVTVLLHPKIIKLSPLHISGNRIIRRDSPAPFLL